MAAAESGLIRGLEGVVATTTRLCDLDGERGRLAYQGYDIDDLARHAGFEEVVWLLWRGELPSPAELQAFRAELTAAGSLPPILLRALKLLPTTMHPMRVLQTGIALLGALLVPILLAFPRFVRRHALFTLVLTAPLLLEALAVVRLAWSPRYFLLALPVAAVLGIGAASGWGRGRLLPVLLAAAFTVASLLAFLAIATLVAKSLLEWRIAQQRKVT